MGGYFLAVVHKLLTAVGSLVAERGALGPAGLSTCNSRAREQRLSSCDARGIFPDPGSNPCLLH